MLLEVLEKSLNFINIRLYEPCLSSVAGVVMCVLSLICALALGYFDKRADRILKRAAVTSGNFLIILLFSS